MREIGATEEPQRPEAKAARIGEMQTVRFLATVLITMGLTLWAIDYWFNHGSYARTIARALIPGY